MSRNSSSVTAVLRSLDDCCNNYHKIIEKCRLLSSLSLIAKKKFISSQSILQGKYEINVCYYCANKYTHYVFDTCHHYDDGDECYINNDICYHCNAHHTNGNNIRCFLDIDCRLCCPEFHDK